MAHIISVRTLAGASLALLMLGLAAFNVRQWFVEGFIILAVVALCAELIGFAMAVMIEVAVRAKRWLAAAVCGLILVVCAGFNVIGAERAWDAAMVRHLDGTRMEAQEALDATRAEMRQKLASAERRVREYDHLLPTADTMRARQSGMQAAWERATAQPRADAEAAQRELDRLPVVAEVASPFVAWQVQLGFGLAELIKALGLWACGFGAAMVLAETQRSSGNAAETEPETPAEPQGNVVSISEKITARRLREAGLSYAQIGQQIGRSKKHAWMLVNR